MAEFKARARAIDMLGRQQIAGIPSAIHELFKNAHDAYADRVEVDYYHVNDAFVLRDDGIGMSTNDFEDRWLTVGTESKLGKTGSSLELPKPPKGKKTRTIMGEKGIGRLAIAAIGPQVLIATKSRDDNSSITAAFINWGFFELPGIDLAEIHIPLATLSKEDFKLGTFVKKFKKDALKLVDEFEEKTDQNLLNRIRSDIEAFNVEPFDYDGVEDGPDILNDAGGMHFYIQPTASIFKADLSQASEDNKEASGLEKYLLGMSNDWINKDAQPLITPKFREHLEDATSSDLINLDNFFTPDEFSTADHHFKGEFDECGNFSGTVSVYGEEAKKYSYSFPELDNRKLSCGPFKLNLAYVPGLNSLSKLPREDWGQISRKLNRFGGLYIYKNGTRILPYGDSDYDFLKIEKRRSEGLSHYYYSYRRMFGAVDINANINSALVEKAGREGFIQNKAYREFSEVLQYFFINTAKDFFRKKGEYSEQFSTVRAQLKEQDKLRIAQEKKTKRERKKFTDSLTKFFAASTMGQPEIDAEAIYKDILPIIEKIKSTPSGELEKSIVIANSHFEQKYSALIAKYEIFAPDDLGLTPTLTKKYSSYEYEFAKIQKEVFSLLNKRFEACLQDAIKSAGDQSVDYKSIAKKQLEEIKGRSTANFRENLKQSRVLALQLSKLFEPRQDEIKSKFFNDIENAHHRFSEKIDVAKSQNQILKYRDQATARYKEALFKGNAELTETEKLLESTYKQLQGKEASGAKIMASLEQRIAGLEEDLDSGLELMQLGMAFGIIQHEFHSAISNVRHSIAKIEPWVEENPELESIFSGLNINFEHLSGYLKLFDPMSRRLRPIKVEITGATLYGYCDNLFRDRLEKENIKLRVTPAFLSKIVYGYTSTFFPVFVNLIDNAIYWLSHFTEQKREITLDAVGDSLLVKDTGPGVEPEFKNLIFDFGFTRKSSGRGMGLHISREALRKEKHNLFLSYSEPEKGAVFTISLNKKSVR